MAFLSVAPTSFRASVFLSVALTLPSVALAFLSVAPTSFRRFGTSIRRPDFFPSLWPTYPSLRLFFPSLWPSYPSPRLLSVASALLSVAPT
ncbi:hypothetical protein ACPCXA_15640, partial [Lysinibacillus agricola]